jgi:peptidoglycan/LPS O-acetylase OafA/YrhL
MKKLNYLGHIDSLRALAVLLVLLFHLDISIFKGGFIGVDIFFVISGFLITRNINHECQSTSRFNFIRFYYRRLKRLLPSFVLTSIFIFILGFLIFSPSDLVALADSIFPGSIALSNLYFLSESGYFDITAKLKPMLHTWSLSVEEQYYFIWPLTLYVILRIFRKSYTLFIIIGLTIVAFAATFYFNTYGVPEKLLAAFSSREDSTTDLQSFMFFLLPFRSFEFLLGALIVFFPEIRIKNEVIRIIISMIGFILIILPGVFFDEHLKYLSVLNVIPCIGISLLIIIPPSKYLSWFYNNSSLRLIGNASYTIYLFHWPLIVYYKHLFDQPLNFYSGTILFILSIIISLLVYQYYETPIRKYRLKNKSLDYLSMVMLLIVFIGGSYALKKNIANNEGWIWRLDDKNMQLIEEIGVPIQYHYNNWGGADYKFDVDLSNQKDPLKKTDLVWFGDSHSGHYTAGIDSILVKKHNLKVHVSYVSCFVLPDVISTNNLCKLDTDSVLMAKIELLEENPKATLVLSYYWKFRLFATCKIIDQETKELIEPSKINREDAYQLVCEKIEKFREILGNDRKIIIIGESPVRTGNVNYIDKLLKPSYLSFISPVSNTFQIEQSVVDFNEYMSAYFNEKSGFYFLDPTEPFCKDGSCLSQVGTDIYFSDINHFSKDGAIHAIQHFEDTLLSIMEIE